MHQGHLVTEGQPLQPGHVVAKRLGDQPRHLGMVVIPAQADGLLRKGWAANCTASLGVKGPPCSTRLCCDAGDSVSQYPGSMVHR